MKKLMKNKRGQLFIIEAFIAVSVMIIMVTALYEVQIATQPNPELYYQEDVYITLKALDNEGLLDEYLYSIKTGSPLEIDAIKDIIQTALYSSLPDNGEFILFCENLTSSQIVTNSWINQGLVTGKETIGVDYLITEVNGIYDPYIYHLQVWLKGI